MNTYYVLSEGFDPRENLALEEYIINNCRSDEVWLYLWQNRNTVVIGRNQNPWRECNMEAIRRDGVTLVRRSSGGGAVFHDDGNLNFTFIAPKELYNLEKQLSVVLRALESFGLHAEFSGRNDILLDGRKFSGNAFSHSHGISMQHGTLLIKTDMTRLAKYLSPSKLKLNAKGVTSVRSRVCNLSDACADITPQTLCGALVEAFQKIYAPLTASIKSGETDKNDYRELIDKYSSWEWIMGQTPQFEAVYEHRFDWGEVQLCYNVRGGLVESARLFSDAMDAELIMRAQAALAGKRATAQALSEAVRDISPALADWIASLPV